MAKVKVHLIEAELTAATGVKPKKGEARATFLKRLLDATGEGKLDDKAFDELSDETQKWVNAAGAAEDDKKSIPDYADVETATPTKGKPEAAPAEEEKTDVATAKKKAAAGGKKPAKKTEAKTEVKTAKGKAASEEGYKGHRADSRKGAIHKLFDEKGADAARAKGIKDKLAEGTLNSWISAWGGGKPRGKKKADK